LKGINIYSGAPGLGGALTNPTELSRQKGSIFTRYPVRYHGKEWPDVETAYKTLKQETTDENDELMVELIAAKFVQHPSLFEEVRRCGGVAFLEQCSHLTNARTEGFRSWEGTGPESRFIRNLVKGFLAAEKGALSEAGQGTLF
jgi:hypothetical protein